VVQLISEALNSVRKSVRGSRVHLFGMAYKPNVGDVRESPALEIMELLQERGAVLCYSDPYIPQLHKMRAHDFSHMTSVPLTVETLRNQDLVLITTDHTNVDYQWLVENSPMVVDTRNATRTVKGESKKIVRA